MEFMVLQAQNKLAPHVTIEDMKHCLTSQVRGAFIERFQKEIREDRDLCIDELYWEVNTHLKLHEMELVQDEVFVVCIARRQHILSATAWPWRHKCCKWSADCGSKGTFWVCDQNHAPKGH